MVKSRCDSCNYTSYSCIVYHDTLGGNDWSKKNIYTINMTTGTHLYSLGYHACRDQWSVMFGRLVNHLAAVRKRNPGYTSAAQLSSAQLTVSATPAAAEEQLWVDTGDSSGDWSSVYPLINTSSYLVNAVPAPDFIDFPKLGFHCWQSSCLPLLLLLLLVLLFFFYRSFLVLPPVSTPAAPLLFFYCTVL